MFEWFIHISNVIYVDFLTGAPPVAEVRSAEPITYLTWNKSLLSQALGRDPQLGEAFNTILTANVAHKLNHASRSDHCRGEIKDTPQDIKDHLATKWEQARSKRANPASV